MFDGGAQQYKSSVDPFDRTLGPVLPLNVQSPFSSCYVECRVQTDFKHGLKPIDCWLTNSTVLVNNECIQDEGNSQIDVQPQKSTINFLMRKLCSVSRIMNVFVELIKSWFPAMSANMYPCQPHATHAPLLHPSYWTCSASVKGNDPWICSINVTLT